jgi:hypothetical protein
LAETNSTLTLDPVDAGGELVAREPEVDEAGAGDLGLRDEIGRELQLAQDALGGLPRIAPLPLGEDHREIRREIAVAGVAGPLEHELQPIGAEPRRDPGELGAKHVAHSPAAFLGLVGSGLDAAGFASALAAGSDLDSAAGFSVSGFRGPFPSLP